MLTDLSGYLIFATTAVPVVACLYFAPAIDISRLWSRRFAGPPVGDAISKRAAAIKAAERAVGEAA